MALTAPQSLALIHSAIRPRGVYLSGPGKVFAIWTIHETGGRRFAAKQHDGAVGSEFIIPVPPDTVFDFDVVAFNANRAVVFYSDGLHIKYFVYDFVYNTLVLSTAIFTLGADPSAGNDGKVRTTFLKDNIAKLITDFDVGEVLDFVYSSGYVLQEHNIAPKVATVLYYLAGHSGAMEIALPIRADVNSVFVHDCRDTIVSSSPDYYSDKSGNGNELNVYSGAEDTELGLRFGNVPDVRIVDWTVPAFFFTLESLFIPSGQEPRGRVLDGDLFVGFDGWGRAYWGFMSGTTLNLYQQTALVGTNRKRLNHVAVTHQWGVAASTKLYTNGILVPGQWMRGNGSTDPALGVITSSVTLGRDDLLVQLSASDIAKSEANITEYAKGRL